MRYIAILVFLLTFVLYVSNLSPTVTSDDSGQLAGVAATLGTAHPPGYPLYSLLGKINSILIPFSNHAYRANLLSAVTAASGVAILYLVLLRFFSVTVSFFSALTCGTSPFLFEMATVTEVYGITILLSALLLLIITSQIQRQTKFYLLFFTLGVGIVSHFILALWVPAIIYLYFKEKVFSLRHSLTALLLFAAGLTFFLFLFVRAQTDPVYNWEDPSNFERFIQVVTRARYGALQLTQGRMNILDFSLGTEKLLFLARSLIRAFSFFGFAAGIAGIIISASQKSKINSLFLLLLFLSSGPVFLIMANVNMDAGSKALLSRFLYLVAIIWTVYMAVTFEKIGRLGGLLAAATFIIVFLNTYSTENRYHFTYHDYAKNLLRNTPNHSIVFFDRADEMEFCVSYLLRAERRRKDIEFIDCNAGVSKSIYGDDYYNIWGKPRLSIRNRVESAIINKSERPVYYATFAPDQTTTPKKPYALLHEAKSFSETGPFFDELFVLRPPRNELRSRSLYFSHFQILGDYYLFLNDFNSAYRNLAVVFYNAATPHPFYKLAHYLYEKNELDKAALFYDRIIHFHPDSTDAHINLGVIFERKGKSSVAEKQYRKAIEISPENSKAYYNLGVLFWKKSDWKNAVKYLQKASELEPANETLKRYISTARQRL